MSKVEQQLAARDEALDALKMQPERAQLRMKTQVDRKCREVQFEVGDKVYLKLWPYRQQSLASWPNEKLVPQYYGPFSIEACVGLVAYRLQLSFAAAIQPFFSCFIAAQSHWTISCGFSTPSTIR